MRQTLISLLLLLFVAGGARAQENYRTRLRQAMAQMNQAKDAAGQAQALAAFENLFREAPDSVDCPAVYKASLLAADLGKNDEAFRLLRRLMDFGTDEYGAPCWTYIVGDFVDDEYQRLRTDARWKALEARAVRERAGFYRELERDEREFFAVSKADDTPWNDAAGFRRSFRTFEAFFPKKKRDYSIMFPINDSTRTSFLVHLPTGYDYRKRHPLLVVLHGAVRNNALTDFQMPGWVLGDWNRFYTQYADREGVILVFPKGNREYNWMTPDDGFYMVPEMVRRIKRAVDVDDARVFVTGHSNGATGAFSYLMKQPNLFAAGYGFNPYPKVFTGGTFVENLRNRSFISFTTDRDYYYPPGANDDFTRLMQGMKTDYKEYRYEGYPHWFPEFDQSEEAVRLLFEDMSRRRRHPYRDSLTWELDDDRYGNIDWLADLRLDTLRERAPWHEPSPNFRITRWLAYDERDSLVAKEVNRPAFDFPRRSGKVRAAYADNTFRIETSRIGSLRLLLSPEMVDMGREIKVYLNGRLCFHGRIGSDLGYMNTNFYRHRDRQAIWENSLLLEVGK